MPRGFYEVNERGFSWSSDSSYFLQKLKIVPLSKKKHFVSKETYVQKYRLCFESEEYGEETKKKGEQVEDIISTAEIRNNMKRNGKKAVQNERLKNTYSMETGLASVALTISKGIGIRGVENVIKKAMDRCNKPNQDLLMKYVADNIIGKDLMYTGPFGPRKVVYCDYTASGKSVQFIEDYIRDEVLPYYGNTHTTTTISSLQTGNLRNEAKQIIRECLNATDEDAVIFVSSGTTGAIGKLIHALELKSAPIVFISPYEHHSNLLPWLEIGAEIIYGVEAEDGTVDLERLEKDLKQHSSKGRPMIGSFSAASNITGILSPVDDIAILLHGHGAYAFFDYATAGPYVDIDMNPHLKDPNKHEQSYKDAMFCSIHKFVGGPGTPGLLVAKKKVFVNPIPSGVGGGTVVFVTHKKHQYVSNIEEREEGGTPAIVESIRAGLVFQLKEEVSPANIMNYEHKYVHMAMRRWENIPNLYILGESEAERLPIFPLVITHPRCPKLLHHNFVSALLNDLFGVQARGGCACAGPYAEDLLGIDGEKALRIADSLNGDFSGWEEIPEDEALATTNKLYGILKPGFCRLNLPYFADEETINYILDSVGFVAEHGWKLLPLYEHDVATGEYRHKHPKLTEHRSQLSDIKSLMPYGLSKIKPLNSKTHAVKKNGPNNVYSYKKILKEAEDIVSKYEIQVEKEEEMVATNILPPVLSKLMTWFLLPYEAHGIIKGKMPSSCSSYQPVFFPRDKLVLGSPFSRTRLKSGLKSDTFCICPSQRLRHIKNKSCMPGYDSKWSRTSQRISFKPRKISSTVSPRVSYVTNDLKEVDFNENDRLARLKRHLSSESKQDLNGNTEVSSM